MAQMRYVRCWVCAEENWMELMETSPPVAPLGETHICYSCNEKLEAHYRENS